MSAEHLLHASNIINNSSISRRIFRETTIIATDDFCEYDVHEETLNLIFLNSKDEAIAKELINNN